MTLTNVPSYEEKRLCCDINQISRTEWAQLRLVYIPENVSNTVDVN